MKRSGNIIGVPVLLCAALSLFAQNPKPDNKAVAAKKDTSVYFVPVYLGQSQYKGGPIPKAKFDELLRHGLTARDSAGNKYNVLGFMFTYVERNLYEDSVGKLIIMPDYLSEYCEGDTIGTNIATSIYERTKQNDTVYFDDISLRKQADGSGGVGRPMRFVITR